MKEVISHLDKNILHIKCLKKIRTYSKKIRKVQEHTAKLQIAQYNRLEIIKNIDYVIKEIRKSNEEIVTTEKNNKSELSDIIMLYNILEEFTFEYDILYDIYNKFILKQQNYNKICKYLHKLRKFRSICIAK